MQNAVVGDSSVLGIGDSVWSQGGGGAVTLYPNLPGVGSLQTAPEFCLVSGQSITLTGSSTISATVREFNNP